MGNCPFLPKYTEYRYFSLQKVGSHAWRLSSKAAYFFGKPAEKRAILE
jgi:hypothetical protein